MNDGLENLCRRIWIWNLFRFVEMNACLENHYRMIWIWNFGFRHFFNAYHLCSPYPCLRPLNFKFSTKSRVAGMNDGLENISVGLGFSVFVTFSMPPTFAHIIPAYDP